MEFLFDDILLPCFSNVPQGDGGDGPRAEAWLQGVETMSLESALSLPTPNLLVKGMDGYDADILAGIPQDQDGPKGHVEVYVYSELRHICQKQRQRPELLQAGAKRRRLAGKQPRSVHDACVMLLDHCTGRKRCAAVSHNQLRLGCSELVRNLARSKGMSYRQARPECSAAWSNAPAALRVAWFLVYQLRQALKVTYRDDAWDTGDPFRPPAGDSAECYGILVTWHTNIGTADPEIRLLEGSKLEEQQLVMAMREVVSLRRDFDDFGTRIRSLASRWGFSAWSCSMELCTHGDFDTRVHLHAYLGHIRHDNGFGGLIPQNRIQVSQLEYAGFSPDIRLVRDGRRAIDANAAGGMYYVACRKKGQLFSDASVWPFQDHGDQPVVKHMMPVGLSSSCLPCECCL